jgi:hypothetical protein
LAHDFPHADHLVDAGDLRLNRAMPDSATSAEAPGQIAETTTCGGTMSGNLHDRNTEQGEQTGKRDDGRDENRKPRLIDEDGIRGPGPAT